MLQLFLSYEISNESRKIDHKCLPQRDPHDAVRNELEEYHLAKQIKLPSQVPASAGGLNMTSK